MSGAVDGTVAGYDIGGAHLKVAVAQGGRLTAVRQLACPLWRGVVELEAALDQALEVTAGAQVHRVTMTGELADVFPDRFTGVARIVEVATAKLGPGVLFWMGTGFGDATAAVARYESVASANFLATAAFVAARPGSGAGLLVDMGSTTTDIIPFAEGRALPSGVTDSARLVSGELVYTGLTRTAVPAMAARGVYDGTRQGLAREPFATMADVYRVLGWLPDGVDLHRTADGRGTSFEESAARLARCFGRDFMEGEGERWRVAARGIADAQATAVVEGCLQVLSRRPECGKSIVAAGIGVEIVRGIAARIGSACTGFAEQVAVDGALAQPATWYAPAVSLALM